MTREQRLEESLTKIHGLAKGWGNGIDVPTARQIWEAADDALTETRLNAPTETVKRPEERTA